MNLIVVSFEDCTKNPASVRAASNPCRGLPDSWTNALVETGSLFSRDHAASGAVSTTGLLLPSSDYDKQFCPSVREVTNLLGLTAHIHKFSTERARLKPCEAARNGARFV